MQSRASSCARRRDPAVARPVPVCADESAHDRSSLAELRGRYDAVNIKLDKSGGLTEALAMAHEAERRGFSVMVGCMVATSLAMAPAQLVAQDADWADLDGPLLLAECVTRTGSYAAMFYLLALAVSALALCAWFVTLPQEREYAVEQL